MSCDKCKVWRDIAETLLENQKPIELPPVPETDRTVSRYRMDAVRDKNSQLYNLLKQISGMLEEDTAFKELNVMKERVRIVEDKLYKFRWAVKDLFSEFETEDYYEED